MHSWLSPKIFHSCFDLPLLHRAFCSEVNSHSYWTRILSISVERFHGSFFYRVNIHTRHYSHTFSLISFLHIWNGSQYFHISHLKIDSRYHTLLMLLIIKIDYVSVEFNQQFVNHWYIQLNRLKIGLDNFVHSNGSVSKVKQILKLARNCQLLRSIRVNFCSRIVLWEHLI